MSALADAQRQLYRLLRDRTDTPSRPPSFGPGAQSRLEVYRRAYFSRLLECMKDDFPRVEARLEGDAFQALVADYVEAYPPRDPALRNLGREFPAFLGQHRPTRPDLRDVARLDWAWIDVFDDEDETSIDRSALAEVPPDAWGGLIFRALKAHRVLETAHPVHEVAVDPGAPLGEARPCTIIVWRRDFRVFVRELAGPEAAAWRAVVDGTPFEAWCTWGASDVTTAAQMAVTWLGQWLDDGLVVDLKS